MNDEAASPWSTKEPHLFTGGGSTEDPERCQRCGSSKNAAIHTTQIKPHTIMDTIKNALQEGVEGASSGKLTATVIIPEYKDLPNDPPRKNDGLRFNEGKNNLALLPPEWVWALGMVMTRGAIKYETRNWEKGMSWAYVLASAWRHLIKFGCGERFDKELGCHHLAMVAWNVLVLMSYDLRKIGTNDMVGDVALLEATYTEMGPELQAIADAKKKAQTSGR